MAARGKTPDPKPDENTLLEESDDSLLAAATRVFGDDLAEGEGNEPPSSVTDPFGELSDPRAVTGRPDFGRPDADDFIQLRGRGGGGAYLPARKRIGWMRGEPIPHPFWTIETKEMEVIVGDLVSGSKVEGGYARIKATIKDELGRVIAQGTKTEFSERFMDYVEKAETGAIARALAVAGFGTESALELDEGYEDGRIADAPARSSVGRPIQITPSSIPDLKQGGRSERITELQIREIARLNRDELKMGLNITSLLEAVTSKPVVFPEGMKDPKDMQNVIKAYLAALTFDEGGSIIQSMQTAVKAAAVASAAVGKLTDPTGD